MAHVGDLIVTGASRYLNPINGDITGTSGNSLKLQGYTSDTARTANTIVRRDGNGYIYAAYYNQSSGAETPTSSSNWVYVNSDGWFRKSTLANARTQIVAPTANNPTLAWSATSTIGTIAGTEFKVTMPANPNTDKNVTQTATNTNANYEVLFSATADNTTRTEGARKYSNLLFNPSTGTLTATKFSGDISGGTGLTKSQVTTALGYTPPTSDTNTHRPIQVNGAEILGNNTTALNLKAGSNVSITNSSGSVTIAATDTNNAVTQTATATDAYYEILFSGTADNTTRTEGARKSNQLHFNPHDNFLTIGDASIDGKNGMLFLKGDDVAHVMVANADNTERINVLHYDITCTGTTWDGTNTSLKTALSKKLGNTGSQTITNGSIYISTSTITTGVGFFAKNRNNIQCYLYCGDDSMGLYSDNGHGGIIRKFLSTNEVAINGAVYSVANPANFRSAIGAAASSSRLTKKNIEDITEAEAKKILDIDVKSFDYKDAYILEGYPKRDKYYGVIAEDVLKKIPYVVNVPDDYDESKIDETKGLHQSLLTVDYDKFVPYLIKMAQIQQKEINELKEKIRRCS